MIDRFRCFWYVKNVRACFFFYHFQNIVRHCTMYKYQKQLRVFPREFSLQIERCRTILVSRVTVRSRDTCDCHILSFFFFLTEITHVAALTMRIRLWHNSDRRNLIQIKLLNIRNVHLAVNWFYSLGCVECIWSKTQKNRPSPVVSFEFFVILFVCELRDSPTSQFIYWPCQRIASFTRR